MSSQVSGQIRWMLILSLGFVISQATACSSSGGGGVGPGAAATYSSSGGSASKALMVANIAMASDQLTFADVSAGGLVGQLYVQPRSLMQAPDTQVVGCGQYGLGALGLDAFLGQPSWITQSLIFTELLVPARNFRLGFPYSTAPGGVLAVDSYFAISATGSFHLGPNDTEGDYQFSLAADDGAQLLVADSSGKYSILVDDEKPAGPNNGCLEQTQATHLSCTANWANQSTTATVTLHLKPGQLVPMKLNYWQGPGGGLGLMAFYRKVADKTKAADLSETYCGQEPDFSEGSDALKEVLSTWAPISFNNLSTLAF